MVNNPFAVISPEELTAEQADQLFVEMHSDYPEITRAGNTLITGARGCGKSMLIRCSLPDFLMVRKNIRFSELPYLAVSVSIKKTDLNLEELHRLDKLHVPYLINEHFLALNVVMQAFLCLSKIPFDKETYSQQDYETFFTKTYLKYLKASGCKDDVDADFSSPNAFFDSLYEHLFLLSCEFIQYISGLFNTESVSYSYTQPLLSFSRFIVPVFRKLLDLPGFPNGKPILIFIDDADNLSKVQTEVLNSWLASRTQPTISLKVSSQIGLYKSYLTSSGVLVESPHDYQEVNISFLYTTKFTDRSFFYKASQILIRRLQLNGYFPDIDPQNRSAVEKALKTFFLPYDKQEAQIKEEEERIRQAYSSSGRGYRESDDVRRYAIPNYIRRLGGQSKSRRTYQYAGLENIIHLSSGIIRYLLDAAAKMYDVAANKNKGNPVEYIPSSVQDDVMRSKADFYLFTELRKSEEINDAQSPIAITSSPQSITDKLGNLINAMGKTFHDILISGNSDDPFSGRSERKVFSIALSNPETLDLELRQVFKLGVRLGFLHESYIGNKDGTGRTNLYILNRCFAPIFTLDPTGFQGYLFITNRDLKIAINSGKQLKNIIENDNDPEDQIYQLTLDDFCED